MAIVGASPAFASEPTTTSPIGVPRVAQTTVHWDGSIADIIPGDNIIITGKSSSVNILVGNLNLEKKWHVCIK